MLAVELEQNGVEVVKLRPKVARNTVRPVPSALCRFDKDAACAIGLHGSHFCPIRVEASGESKSRLKILINGDGGGGSKDDDDDGGGGLGLRVKLNQTVDLVRNAISLPRGNRK